MSIVTKSILVEALNVDFSDHSDSLLKVCLNEHGYPIGGKHVDIIEPLTGPSLSDELITKIGIIYVYFASSFFCMDHVFDDESTIKTEITAPCVLFSAGISRFQEVLSTDNALFLEILSMCKNLFLNFYVHMNEEHISSKNTFLLKDEYTHVAGRSSLFIFAFQILQIFKKTTWSEQQIRLLRDFIFYMQHGDDLGDWREDLKNNKWTPTLKLAYSRMQGRNYSKENFENFMYLTGFYEERCSYISQGLAKIATQVNIVFSYNPDPFVDFINLQVKRIETIKNNFKKIKSGEDPDPLPVIQ